jgi:hypothetical protein
VMTRGSLTEREAPFLSPIEPTIDRP